MKTMKKLLLPLVFALGVIASVLLWGRPVLPCRYNWYYAAQVIVYIPRGAQGVLPDDGFPSFPPLCLEIQRLRGYRL